MEEFLSNKVDELRKQLVTASAAEQLLIIQQIILLEEQLLRMG